MESASILPVMRPCYLDLSYWAARVLRRICRVLLVDDEADLRGSAACHAEVAPKTWHTVVDGMARYVRAMWTVAAAVPLVRTAQTR